MAQSKHRNFNVCTKVPPFNVRKLPHAQREITGFATKSSLDRKEPLFLVLMHIVIEERCGYIN